MQATNAVKVLQAVLEKMAERTKIAEKASENSCLGASVYNYQGYATAKSYCENEDYVYGLLMDLVAAGQD